MRTVVHHLTCGHELGTEALLDAVVQWWPQQKWGLVVCPRCEASWHIEVHDELVAIGSLDGAPGPGFMADERRGVPGLSLRGETIGYRGRTWRIAHRAVSSRP